MGRQIIAVVLFVAMALCSSTGNVHAGDVWAAVLDDKPLMVFFDKGKSAVSDADKARIKQMVGDLRLAPADKIIVVGHSDSSGDEHDNLKLSYKRAQSVRHQIIGVLGGKVDEAVLAVAMGSEDPVADNNSKNGRARNRRVEIYYAQMLSGGLMVNHRRVTPDMATVEKLVQDARALLRRQQLREALQLLQEARDQGGDRFSNWHALFGIAGYYAGMAPEKVKSHLNAALRLDPFNEEARAYLGRLDARGRVAAGTVTPAMGRSPEKPITILSESQAHEYLRLFGVQAISHDLRPQDGLEVWRCRDVNGNIVSYHFDRSRLYEDLY